MPFGRTNTPAVFQALVNDVLRNTLNRFIFIYLDDILVFSRSAQEHMHHVPQVLQHLLENQLFVKAEKSPYRHFPVLTVKDILKDVLANYLQQEKYEAELCRQKSKTSEVIKARVEDLIVMISIGQFSDQNVRIGCRFLWDTSNETPSRTVVSSPWPMSMLFTLSDSSKLF
uniref:ribonuclease H n=1 Tax=Hucho hucho TaxID=62062 RepID=A0A4W5JI67_9TELE